MRIYIDNYIISDLKKKEFDKYETKTTHYNELVSKENGIYHIFEDNIYQITTNEDNFEILNDYYNNFDLVIDKSITINKKILSQLPLNYFCVDVTKTEYMINKKSKIILIIETINNNSIPIDFYFEIKDENNNSLKDKFVYNDFIFFLDIL
jgi:hypothetical protein